MTAPAPTGPAAAAAVARPLTAPPAVDAPAPAGPPEADSAAVIDAVFPDRAAAVAAPAPGLAQALDDCQARLAAAGLACRGLALHGDDLAYCLPFAQVQPAVAQAWSAAQQGITPQAPVFLARLPAELGADLLLATEIVLPNGRRGAFGALLAPPHQDRHVQILLLAVAWLQTMLSAQRQQHDRRAAALLELMAHVASQAGARAGAQEWINRLSAGLRAELADTGAALALTLFEVRADFPRWWVSSDAAWSETASPLVQDAAELAARAVAEDQDVAQHPWWATPLRDQGQVRAVLVVRLDAPGLTALPEGAGSFLRASAGLAEPLLRHWREAERSLPAHAWASCRWAWRRVWGPGHLTWKAGALGLVLGALGLLVWPVPDRVTANTVIEGGSRQVVTAPFDGFIAQVLVRPGTRVLPGQALLRLDDRDLRLEQGKVRSERDQAAAKLRQAMADRDPSAMALARAELQQGEALLALVDAKLSRTVLAAPIEGLVVTGDWAQQVGAPVESGKELFELATTDAYRVVLHVPDSDINRLAAGQAGLLRLTAQPQAAYPFTVRRITATASVQERVNGFRVEADWVGQVPPLSPGMQGIGKVEVGQTNLLTVWTRPTVNWLRLKLWSWW